PLHLGLDLGMAEFLRRSLPFGGMAGVATQRQEPRRDHSRLGSWARCAQLPTDSLPVGSRRSDSPTCAASIPESRCPRASPAGTPRLLHASIGWVLEQLGIKSGSFHADGSTGTEPTQ